MTALRVAMLYSREYVSDDAVQRYSSLYLPDVRLQKEAHTLALAGYDVTILAWDRVGKLPPQHMEEAPERLTCISAAWSHGGQIKPVTVTHLHVPAGYRTGRRLILPMLRFWMKLVYELRRLRPDVIHANNLDTLPIAILYHWLWGVPVIYDAREYYPGMVQGSVGRLFSKLLDGLDRMLAPRAAAIITVGDRLAAYYRRMSTHLKAKTFVVHNSQLPFEPAALEWAGREVRCRLGVPDDALLVAYVGLLTPDRVLLPLLDAVSAMEQVWLVIGGDGPQAEAIQQAAKGCSRIHVLGRVPLEQVPSVVSAADVVYYGLDMKNPNSFYFMPNLAFFAFGAGRPLLVTPVGEIAEVVRTEKCGVVLSSASAAAVRQGLLDIQGQRLAMSERARLLGQHEYQWGFAAERLLQTYTEVR